jgi:hypothetical protein
MITVACVAGIVAVVGLIGFGVWLTVPLIERVD